MSTSRLKRKAENDPDLLADTNLLESFVTYGTPLPSLASTKRDQGEYVPVWKQEVRDEKGRRRLHGAFTGGFSAGYFNTAGSKEGWAPSTFVSSKEAKSLGRAGGSAARPEDFMDEEDLAELKAARGFQTSDEYGNVAKPDGLAEEGGESYSSAMANAMKDLVKPGSSKIGEKMMLKMGWKPGQGIGPRVSYARRKEQMRQAGIRSSLPETAEEVDETDEAKKHLYAPLDRPLELFAPKEDTRGLGYQAGKSLKQSLAIPAGSEGDRKGKGRDNGTQVEGKRIPTGGAFGISALEDADEDDDDVYSSTLGDSGTLVLNDFDDDDQPNFGDPQIRRKIELIQRSSPHDKGGGLKERHKPPKQPEENQRFADGSLVMRGFTLASKPQPPDKWFPAAPVPKDWQPNPRAVWDREKLSTQPRVLPSGTSAVQQKGKQNMLSADDRGSILGEASAPRSVFEFMSAKNKERLQTIAQGGVPAPSAYAVQPPSMMPDEDLRIPEIDSRIAQSALKGFMPYGDDPAKQSRYKTYLSHFAAPGAPGNAYMPRPPPGKTVSDLNIELGHFASAASIFKPMSGMMANRFTSGSSAGTLLDIKAPDAGLRQPVTTASRTGGGSEEEQRKRKEQEEQEKDERDPRRLAVRAGEYGRLTRTSETWYPARLLCKRFNVADPHPDGPSATDSLFPGSQANLVPSGEKEVLNQDTMDEIMRGNTTAPSSYSTGTVSTLAADAPTDGMHHSQSAGPPNLAIVGLGEDDTQGRDTLTYEKPSMDIFKAIFADSDEEEDEADVAAPVQPSDSSGMQVDDPSAYPEASILATVKVEQPGLSVTMDNIASFKPTFVVKADRSALHGDKKDKEKKKKKKASAAATLSFDVDDEGQSSIDTKESKDKPKKRKTEDRDKEKKRDRKKQSAIEEDEWVEKEQPSPMPTATPISVPPSEASRRNGRMKASELF